MNAWSELGERQHGAVARHQLGLARHEVRHLERVGLLVPLSRDVFRIAGAPQTWLQQVHAAVLSAPGSLASHATAAELWGMPSVRRDGIHIVQRRNLNHDRALGVVHQAPWLPERFARTVDGIPVVAPAVALFQMAGCRNIGWVARAMDDALVRRLVTSTVLEEAAWLLCRRGRPGTRAFRALVEERTAVGYVATESELEAKFLRLVREAGLPEPEKQVNLGGEAWIGRVDYLSREVNVVFELDGRRHQTALLQVRDDKLRDIELVRSGRRVVRLHWDELTKKRAWVKQLLIDLLRPAA